MIASTANIRRIAKSSLLCWARGHIDTPVLIDTLRAVSSVSETTVWLDLDDCVGLVLDRIERHLISFDDAVILLARIAQA